MCSEKITLEPVEKASKKNGAGNLLPEKDSTLLWPRPAPHPQIDRKTSTPRWLSLALSLNI